MKMKIYVMATLISMAFQANAINCKDPQNQMENNECSANELEKEDKLLNKVYGDFRKSLEKKDQDKLKTAQISWIKYKEQFCEFEGSLMEGGSMMPLVISECKKELTQQQRKRITSLIR
jgi:uncharacterized protein YecT (DUF1311 family)